MSRFPLPVLTYPGEIGDIARQLAYILGPAYQAKDGSAIAADLIAYADAITLVRATTRTSIDQAFVSTTTDLIEEHENERGLPHRTDLSTADRQARLVAKARAAFAGTPDNIETAVDAVALTVTLVEYASTAGAVDDTNDERAYLLAVVIDPADWEKIDTRNAVDAVVQQMKPAYARATITTNTSFILDDSGSQLDRDLLAT